MSEVKLKRIVQKMINAGEPDELIKEVVTKYRAQNPPKVKKQQEL